MGWCLRCLEPVRRLTPRERPLPAIPPEELIDPGSVRPDYTPLRLHRPTYSRTVGGPTSLGLLGRLAVTGGVLLFLPWGMVGPGLSPLGLVMLLGYAPLAVVVLRSTWAPTPLEAGHVYVLPRARTATGLRIAIAGFGAAIAAVGLASAGSPLAVIPGGVLLAVAVTPLWGPVMLGVAEVLERPIQIVVALNLLNVVDILASDAAIRAGEAAELNPLVGTVGSAGKVAIVLACSLVLYRIRPRALVWPLAAFFALTVYHLTGWLVMV